MIVEIDFSRNFIVSCRYEQFGNMPRMYQKNEENEAFLSKGLKEETHVYVFF